MDAAWKDASFRILQIECADGTHQRINTRLLTDASARLRRELEFNPDLLIQPYVNLNDCEITGDGFNLVKQWLVDGSFDWEGSCRDTMHDIDMLCKAYRTGWDLEITSDFLDMVMDRLIEYVTTEGLLADGHMTDDANADDIYYLLLDTFAVGSPGRRFILDWLLHSELDQDEATERILDVMKQDRVLSREIFFERCLSRRPERAPWATDLCAYHLHLDNEPTCQGRRAKAQGQTQLLDDEG